MVVSISLGWRRATELPWEDRRGFAGVLLANMASTADIESALGMNGMLVSVAIDLRGARHCCVVLVFHFIL